MRRFELSPCALYNNDCDYLPRTNERTKERQNTLKLSRLWKRRWNWKVSLYNHWEIKNDRGTLRRNLDKNSDLTIGITREHGCVVTSSFRGFSGSMHTLVTLVTAKYTCVRRLMTRIYFWNILYKGIFHVSTLSIHLSRIDCSNYFSINADRVHNDRLDLGQEFLQYDLGNNDRGQLRWKTDLRSCCGCVSGSFSVSRWLYFSKLAEVAG